MIAVEEPIAHGASTHTAANVAKAQLAFEAKPLGRGTRADDHRVGVDFRLLVVTYPNLVPVLKSTLVTQPYRTSVSKRLAWSSRSLSLWTVDACRVARKVVDFGRFRQLSAGLLPLVRTGFMSARAA